MTEAKPLTANSTVADWLTHHSGGLTDLDGPDIARELVLSLKTVRTHTTNIYAKLGVKNRRAAVRRAQELDLMSRNRDR
jgi:hypothetical protein